MADTQSNNAFDDELLSAYVDGELSADQVALVEQRLGVDPQAKLLVEELRALSETLHSMPRETVSEDLREAVLQQAERLKLSRDSRTTGGVRRWGWAAMALAAMLLLMVFQPGGEREEQPLASVDVEREKAVQPVLELRVPLPESREAEEEVAESKVAKEAVVGKPSAAVVDELGVLDRAVEGPEDPIQEVHLVLTDGGGEFDKLLVSNGLVRVDQWRLLKEGEMGRKRRMALGDQLSGSGMTQEKETSRVEEVLAEGTAEQIKKMLFACLADQRRYSELRSDKKSAGADFFARSSSQSSVLAVEGFSASADYGEAVESSAEASLDDVSGLSTDNQKKEGGRVQVLFLLHRAPLSAKPVDASKKARKSEKAGGKEG